MNDPDSPDQTEPGVLESLPSTRPQRRSPKRDAPRPRTAPRRAAPKRTLPTAEATAPPAEQGFEPDRVPVEPPSGADMLVTAVQAAGELAQLGVTLGEQLLRAAARRFPKP